MPTARIVLYEKIGPGSHPCHWCKKRIEWIVGAGVSNPAAIIADHIDFDVTNDSPENLVPSCNVCNSHRRHQGKGSLIADDELWIMWSGVRTRAVELFCQACGKPFLTIPAQVKAGRGRFCSRSCARSKKLS